MENKHANACMRKMTIAGRPHLVLFAQKDINQGDEIVYDYGDSDENLWWRNGYVTAIEIKSNFLIKSLCYYV